MTWLDAHLADLALPLLLLIVGAAVVAVTAIAEHFARYRDLCRRARLDGVDARRCERAGSQDEFVRRLRAGGGR